MKVIAIVGGGPEAYLPALLQFQKEITYWIGADRGALSLIQQGIFPDIAVGDFDSVSEEEKLLIEEKSGSFLLHGSEKNETDLELAVMEAVRQEPDELYLFGVTGGRLDHELANLQLLYLLKQKGIDGVIMDKSNQVRMAFPGTHYIKRNSSYPFVSFLPFTPEVKEITLTGFYYPLHAAELQWGSTRCISNEIENDCGVLTFKEGILYIIQSREPLSENK